tara:strand:- start:1105 stop:1311 length:207 start_codon:yes stop_codon:yes gene_type:complete
MGDYPEEEISGIHHEEWELGVENLLSELEDEGIGAALQDFWMMEESLRGHLGPLLMRWAKRVQRSRRN